MRVLLSLFVAAALFAQNTAKFPTATATFEDLLVARDDSRGVLSASIDDSTLSIPVADGSKFSAYNAVTIEGEQILVCSASGNTLTVCAGGRGFAGSTAASHGNGIAVMGYRTAWHHNQLAAEIKAIEEALGVNLSNTTQPDGSNAVGTWPISISGTAAKASALDHDPGACAANRWARDINASGTLTCTQPGFANLSGTAALSQLPTGDYSSLITSGTYGINITGSAATANSVDWANVVSKLDIHAGRNNEADKLVRTDVNGYVQTGYINMFIGTDTLVSQYPAHIYAAADDYIRRYSVADIATAIGQAKSKQINFVYGGDLNVPIGNTTIHNVWRAHTVQATVLEVGCWTDAGTVTLELLRSDGGAMHSGLYCSTAGASTTAMNGYQWIPYGYGIGFRTSAASGVKNLSISISYTPVY